jgi:hypothetical protein
MFKLMIVRPTWVYLGFKIAGEATVRALICAPGDNLSSGPALSELHTDILTYHAMLLELAQPSGFVK